MHKSDIERFIECVRIRPYLYDRNDEHYKDNKMKQVAWTEIAKEFSMADNKAAQNQWRRIRDNFREAMRRQTCLRKGQIALQFSKYKFQSQLSFLIPFFTTRETADVVGDSTYSHLDGQETNSVEKKKNDISVAKKRRKARIKKPLHRLDLFFKTICETTKEMPEVYQAEVERLISNVVNDAKQTRIGTLMPDIPEDRDVSEKYIDSDGEDFHYFKSLMPYMNRLMPMKKLLIRTEFQNILFREMKNPHDDVLYSDNTTSFVSPALPNIQSYHNAPGSYT